MKNLLYKLMRPLNFFLTGSPTTDPDYNSSISPIYEFIDSWGPYLIAFVFALSSLYAIVLMVQYVKAEDTGARDAQKKKVINAIISMAVVILLLVILYAMRDTVIELMNDTN